MRSCSSITRLVSIGARGIPTLDAKMPEVAVPVITVHMEKGRSIEKKRALADAVTKAVAVALDVPPEWVTVIIDEVERENWAIGGRLQLDKLGPGYGRDGVQD
jgi:4-oxalocrotonate tautomerase